jgi:hypothetical protein
MQTTSNPVVTVSQLTKLYESLPSLQRIVEQLDELYDSSAEQEKIKADLTFSLYSLGRDIAQHELDLHLKGIDPAATSQDKLYLKLAVRVRLKLSRILCVLAD